MDLALLVYAISLLNPISGFMHVGIFITGILAIGTIFASCTWRFDSSEYSWNCNKDGTVKESVLATRKFVERCAKWALALCIVFSIFSIFIPKEKTAYMMVGAYTAQKIAQDPKVEQVGAKVLTIINQKLDQYVDDGIEEAKKVAEKKSKK